MEGYKAPNGNWYQSPECEIKHIQECLDNSAKARDVYQTMWKWFGNPTSIYFSLRAIGHLAGISELNPEMDAGLMTYADSAAFAAFLICGPCKLAEWLMNLDIRSTKKDLEKARKRLGLEEAIE